MKKIIALQSLFLTALITAAPAYAQSADISSVQTFLKSVINVLVTLATLVAAGFFVWGGFRYITSSGNPESLDGAKKTIIYSAVGLVIVLAAFVITNVVTDLAHGAFGS